MAVMILLVLSLPPIILQRHAVGRREGRKQGHSQMIVTATGSFNTEVISAT